MMTKATHMSPPPKLGRSWYRQTNMKNPIQPNRYHRRPTRSRTNSVLYLQK